MAEKVTAQPAAEERVAPSLSEDNAHPSSSSQEPASPTEKGEVELQNGKKVLEFNDDPAMRKLERSLLWKMDLQVVTISFFLYFLSFLDRSNIAQGRLNGLEMDLGMDKARDYSIALSLLYPAYILFEIPSNLLLKPLTPRIWLPTLLTAWGLVTTLQGIVTSKQGLYINRVFLGLAEAGVLPGISLWLTFFYKPKELMVRQALYFSGASLSGAFSGLLSVAIGNLDGVRGLGGWQWIFILEGIFTVVVGLFFFAVLPSGPANLWWVTPEERQLAITRLNPPKTIDGKDAEEDLVEEHRWSEVVRAIVDPRNLLFAVTGFLMAAGLYSLSFFAPTIIKGLDPTYTTVQAQLLSCPPYAVAFVVSIIFAVISDRYEWRYPVAIASMALAVIGWIVAVATPASMPRVRYGSLIILAPGLFSNPPAVLSWLANSNAGHTKRAVAIGLYITFTNSGGLASVWMWSDGPTYRTGFVTNLILTALSLVTLTLLELYLVRDIRRKKAGKNDALVQRLREEGNSERRIYVLLGDRHPEYKPLL